MMSAQEILYFIEIAGTLNLSRAAERLGVSQPTLTHAIKRLEDELKAKVFHRTKQGVHLTTAGEKLLASSFSLVEAWDRVAVAVLETKQTVQGRLKLGCHPSVARYTLPFFLPSLLRQNPGIEVRLSHGLSRHISEEVISWKLDFGIVVNPPPHPDLVIKELCQDKVTLWMHKRSQNKDVLIYDPDLLQVQNILDKMRKAKINFPRSIHSSNLEVIASLVAADCGVGILPERVIKLHTASDIQPWPEAPSFKDRICLVYRAGTQDSAAAKKFVQSVLGSQY